MEGGGIKELDGDGGRTKKQGRESVEIYVCVCVCVCNVR